MDYSQLSDQEINIKVARIIHPEREVIESKSRPPSACVIGHLPSKWLDYCNNPADAWPIIDESNITIINDHPEIRYAVNNLNAYRNGDRGCIVKSHSNGFRAAMIVFLMMQDAKHA